MTSATSPSPSAEFLAGQRQLLENERAKIEAGLANAEHDLAELRNREDVAEVDFSEEGGEGASTGSERSQIEALKAQLTVRLASVDAAVERMEAGVYGVCESCRGPIGDARLEAMPCKSAPWTARR
jgi:RNA polymerase-binding transcription factor DksA